MSPLPPPLTTRASAPHSDASEEAALAASIVSGFLLTDAQVASLRAGIERARRLAYSASYQAAATASGAALPQDWEMPEDAAHACADQADQRAQSVATTYHRDLTAAALAFLSQWGEDHEGDLTGASAALGSHLQTWVGEHADWKAPQIANAETSDAGHDGTLDAVDDVMSGDLVDGETGDAIDYSVLEVMVLPEESSGDYCALYAGQVFAYEDAPTLDFPAHPNCIHYVVIFDPTDTSGDEDPFDF